MKGEKQHFPKDVKIENGAQGDEANVRKVVVLANTSPQKWAMVIELFDAVVAYFAMGGSRRPVNVAFF